jgi:hypothetical protein
MKTNVREVTTRRVLVPVHVVNEHEILKPTDVSTTNFTQNHESDTVGSKSRRFDGAGFVVPTWRRAEFASQESHQPGHTAQHPANAGGSGVSPLCRFDSSRAAKGFRIVSRSVCCCARRLTATHANRATRRQGTNELTNRVPTLLDRRGRVKEKARAPRVADRGESQRVRDELKAPARGGGRFDPNTSTGWARQWHRQQQQAPQAAASGLALSSSSSSSCGDDGRRRSNSITVRLVSSVVVRRRHTIPKGVIRT